MPSRSLAPEVEIRNPAPARCPTTVGPRQPGRGVDGDADRLVDHDDGRVVVDDLDALDDLGDDLERVGLDRDLDVEHRALQHPLALADVGAVEPHPAVGDQLGGPRPGQAEQLGHRDVDPLVRRGRPGPAGSGGRRWSRVVLRVVSVSRRLGASPWRVPSIRMPRKTWSRIRPAPTLIEMSATLKIGQFGSWRKSMTCPRNGPGSRSIRSVRLPVMPARIAPRPAAQTAVDHLPAHDQHDDRRARWPGRSGRR